MAGVLSSILSAFGAASGAGPYGNSYGNGYGTAGPPTTQAAIDSGINHGSSNFSGAAQLFSGATPPPDTGAVSTTGNYNSGGLFQGGRVVSAGYGGGGYGGAGGAQTIGFNGGAGGGGGNLMQLLQQQWDARNTADRKRFKKLLGLAQQYGAGQLADNAQQLKNENAASSQALMSKGLGNSTITSSVASSNADRAQRRALDINQRGTQMQMDVYNNQQNQGPDLGLYAQLFGRPGATTGNYGIR